MIDASYIGSCRYQECFTKFYPARLHSLKEVIFFLDNLDLLKQLHLSPAGKETLGYILNVISGDSCEPSVYQASRDFFSDLCSFFDSHIYVIEVSSLSYLQRDALVASAWYANTYPVFSSGFFEKRTMRQREVCIALHDIYTKLSNLSKSDCILYVIPHVDLPIDSTSLQRIEKRMQITKYLEQAIADLKNDKLRLVPIWNDMRRYSSLTLQEMMESDDPVHPTNLGNDVKNELVIEYLQSQSPWSSEKQAERYLSYFANKNTAHGYLTEIQNLCSQSHPAITVEYFEEIGHGKYFWLSSSFDHYPRAGIVTNAAPFFFHTGIGRNQSITIDFCEQQAFEYLVIVNRLKECKDRARRLYWCAHDGKPNLSRFHPVHVNS